MMFSKGFTLLELIIAISIIIVGIVGISLVFSRIISIFPIVSSRLVAAYLAQEGVEIVRNIRDTNWLEQETNPDILWNDGLLECSVGCEADYNDATLTFWSGEGRFLNIDASDFYSYEASDSPTIYKRKITIDEQIDVDILKVIVQVFWAVKGKPYSLEVEEYLYNWY